MQLLLDTHSFLWFNRKSRVAMKIRKLKGIEHFKPHELLELGQRLTETQLRRMGLYDGVRQAEQELPKRLKEAATILAEFAPAIQNNLLERAQSAEEHYRNPKRKVEEKIGYPPKSAYYREFPEPGTLMIVEKRWEGTWRFVVVEEPFSVVLLGEKDGRLYNSPSKAAWAATRTTRDGYKFFDIKTRWPNAV